MGDISLTEMFTLIHELEILKNKSAEKILKEIKSRPEKRLLAYKCGNCGDINAYRIILGSRDLCQKCLSEVLPYRFISENNTKYKKIHDVIFPDSLKEEIEYGLLTGKYEEQKPWFKIMKIKSEGRNV